jgi:hypothetical protein
VWKSVVNDLRQRFRGVVVEIEMVSFQLSDLDRFLRFCASSGSRECDVVCMACFAVCCRKGGKEAVNNSKEISSYLRDRSSGQ